MPNRRRLLGLAAAMALAACATTPAQRSTELTVVTFNIWHDMGDWPARRPLVIEALRATNADVIALQEVLQDEGLPNQAEDIARALGGYSVHFVSVDPPEQARRYGNAILTRLPVLETGDLRLRPLEDSRTLATARISVGGRPVVIAATHLHHTPEGGAMRASQISDALGAVDTGTDAPVILLGDFNAAADAAEFSPVRQAFVDALGTANPPAAARSTLVTDHGHRSERIDHIFVETDRFDILSAGLAADRAVSGIWPSDHVAVVTRLRLR
ncbi:MAG: endonuclease/exonuclease/phosphatase family metal-dependent hydrolase [Brevundimonas sp.]|jgi:endonuclease/exonuclease/phosphatase family metal-dependent hydrolase|uniref:endonuclease/exonuclease/phosphatase family protein n=1 Tax=Brevundimonas sp. TaxID=1871086 RepID=UPI0039E40975